MASVRPELYLYNLSLQKDSGSTSSVIGNFSGQNGATKRSKRSQELVVASSSVLKLFRFNSSTGKLHQLFAHDTFSTIRSIAVVRVSGSSTDNLVVTSDSGTFTVLTVGPKNDRFEPLYNEPYAKSGITRLSPGEYVSVDDKGRALMLSAVEKNKLVYVLNREAETDKITVSSPLEANKSRNLTYFTCGLDVGYENPVFAAIELDYGEAAAANSQARHKLLNYYELDLGLNHVVRKYSERVDRTANFMLAIPGGLDGPSGVLLCQKNVLQYKYFNEKSHVIPIPKRASDPDADSYIVSGVVHKMKGSFFILVQSNFGDLFKVSVEHGEDSVNNPGDVTCVEIKYFDTLPIMRSLLIFKSGFLFADSEHGDKYVYQFEKTGDDESRSWRSSSYGDLIDAVSDDDIAFEPKSLDNLGLVDIVESLNPVMDSRLLSIPKFEEESADVLIPSVYAACGSAARSSLKILTREIPVTELVSSELPADAQQVFTTKIFETDEFDKLLVLSFLDGTLVLSIGETVEEVTSSGIATDGPTLLVQQMGPASLVQVQEMGVRSLLYDQDAPDAEPTADEWLPPAGVKILHAAATQYQLVVGLSNRELVYFDFENGKLVAHGERPEALGAITSLALEKLEGGSIRARFVAVGTSENTIHMMSTHPQSVLEELAVQALSSTPVDLKIAMSVDNASASEDSQTSTLYLHIGMADGIYARIGLDDHTGAFADVRSAVIGAKPVKLSLVEIFGQNMVLCFSTRTYVGFSADYNFTLLAVQNKILAHGFGFKSEDCPENGLVGVYSNVLTIFTADDLKNDFMLESVNLRYTPKKFVEKEGLIYVIESDNNVKSPYIGDGSALQDDEQVEQDDNESQEMFQQFGYPESLGQWASCVQTISVVNRAVVQTVELSGNNETAVSICLVTLQETDFLAVGTSKDQHFLPNSSSGSFVRLYEITEGGLKFRHSTKIDGGVPLSMVPFHGKLLIGAGNKLVLYDLGLKQLLRKSYFETDTQQIVKIDTFGNRIAVADIRQSITFIVFKPLDSRFIAFATDSIARHVVTFAFADYDTVVGSDRFGQLFVLRCPEEVSKLSDEDSHGTYIATKEKFLNGCPYRLDNLANYYVPDVVTSFSKGHLSINDVGSDSMVYTGLGGTVGILIPMMLKSEIDFFVSLQKLIRDHNVFITDSDHLKFRSYYVPLKCVVDGDLVECFTRLDAMTKLQIAGKLDSTVRNIEKRISDMRSRVYF